MEKEGNRDEAWKPAGDKAKVTKQIPKFLCLPGDIGNEAMKHIGGDLLNTADPPFPEETLELFNEWCVGASQVKACGKISLLTVQVAPGATSNENKFSQWKHLRCASTMGPSLTAANMHPFGSSPQQHQQPKVISGAMQPVATAMRTWDDQKTKSTGVTYVVTHIAHLKGFSHVRCEV